MDTDLQTARPNTTASRITRCLWCQQPVAYIESLRQHGFCRACLQDDPEVGWRLVYDRDRQIGTIPENLRAAYAL
ncbi:MAG TPA: hypothetical protein VMU16_14710 [Candidatus Binataceae bacterium]|nr:hypothetical protein [Candidatus Binataceae bacterium]